MREHDTYRCEHDKQEKNYVAKILSAINDSKVIIINTFHLN